MVDEFPDDLKCSKRTLAKTLKQLGDSRKKLKKIPAERNSAQNISARRVFAQAIARKADTRLFYLDETGFNLHSGPRYGYSSIGTTPCHTHPGNRGQNLSVLACIGYNGVVLSELKDGAYDGPAFSQFLDQLLPLLPQGTILIMDNAKFHKRADIKHQLESAGQLVKYLPPYSPQLNPIEEFWAVLKNKQAALRPRPRDRAQLRHGVLEVLKELEHFDMSGFYSHMRRFLSIAAQSEPFL